MDGNKNGMIVIKHSTIKINLRERSGFAISRNNG